MTWKALPSIRLMKGISHASHDPVVARIMNKEVSLTVSPYAVERICERTANESLRPYRKLEPILGTMRYSISKANILTFVFLFP